MTQNNKNVTTFPLRDKYTRSATKNDWYYFIEYRSSDVCILDIDDAVKCNTLYKKKTTWHAFGYVSETEETFIICRTLYTHGIYEPIPRYNRINEILPTH